MFVAIGRVSHWIKNGLPWNDKASTSTAESFATSAVSDRRGESPQSPQQRIAMLLSGTERIRSVNQLKWDEFELLLCEVFTREGYSVEHTGSDGPDGGIDIWLSANNGRTIVQCKHWRSRQVGVTVVRELLGLMVSHRAHASIIVTSGSFTSDATEFASQNGVRLIDGHELQGMIDPRKIHPATAADEESQSNLRVNTATNPKVAPTCPDCGGSMKIATAKRGRNVGLDFWSCKRFPKCRGIIDIP